MSVPASRRNENQTLKTLLLTMDLAYYTVKICCNENVFIPKYRNAVTDDLIRLAKDIYINCRTANGIRVSTIEDLASRSRLQLQAKADCDTLIQADEDGKSHQEPLSRKSETRETETGKTGPVRS